ncbi:hypothetical protein TFLX_03153 [Thermoflexales bacterium]|nr:hypothetical protein TFLX_03153 [Thermoflexales bacterium]
MGISLKLSKALLKGNAVIGDYTGLLRPTWRRTVRRRGGFFTGTARLTQEQLTRPELDQFVRDMALAELQEMHGGLMTWQGIILSMVYTRNGVPLVHSAADNPNAIKAIYTRTFDNLLTNGGSESGAWTAFNSATVTQSTEWKTGGVYSGKIEVGDTAIRGADVQASIDITAGKAYRLMGQANCPSASWRVALNRTDNDQTLGFYSTRGRHGLMPVDAQIPASNEYTGEVRLRVTSEASAGTIYLDDLVLKEVDQPGADTGWYSDDMAITEYGRREDILLLDTLSDEAALGAVQSQLLGRAWPQIELPRQGSTQKTDGMDTIDITLAGPWATLNWLYVNSFGTLAASDHVLAIRQQCAAFVNKGAIMPNALPYTIEAGAQLRCGDVLKSICDSGEASGSDQNFWEIGVGRGRNLYYNRVSPDLTYQIKDSQLLDVGGTPIDPWLARPGWAEWRDLPLGVRSISSRRQHDPRRLYLQQVEMLPPTAEHPKGVVNYSVDEQ